MWNWICGLLAGVAFSAFLLAWLAYQYPQYSKPLLRMLLTPFPLIKDFIILIAVVVVLYGIVDLITRLGEHW